MKSFSGGAMIKRDRRIVRVGQWVWDSSKPDFRITDARFAGTVAGLVVLKESINMVRIYRRESFAPHIINLAARPGWRGLVEQSRAHLLTSSLS